MNRTVSPLHWLQNEGLSVPRGVRWASLFFLDIHTFFFFIVGVVVDLGASSCGFRTFFSEGAGTSLGVSFFGLGLFFYSDLLFFFLRPSTN
jgi:hypothetical protein